MNIEGLSKKQSVKSSELVLLDIKPNVWKTFEGVTLTIAKTYKLKLHTKKSLHRFFQRSQP